MALGPLGRRQPPQSRLPRATYVAQVIPVGFEAYARVLHPARRTADGTPVRWVEVAAALVELLRPFTARPADVWVALWEGWGSPVPLGHMPSAAMRR